jgi:Ca2+-binding RTX toxin-like protein
MQAFRDKSFPSATSVAYCQYWQFWKVVLGKGMSNGNRVQNRLSFNGIVERVWEDGFSLSAGNRILPVDAWDLYGDATQRYVTAGEQLTVFGEFDDGEFDAFSITLEGSSGSNGAGTHESDSDTLVSNNRINVIRGTNGSDDLTGGRGRDRLIGSGGDDDLFGAAGNDILVGGDGNDDLFGGNGNDILRGSRGQDDLVGGAGRDTLIGGADRDTFILQPRGNDIIRDFQDGIDELGLSGGLSFNNLILQQRDSNTLILADGNRVALLLNVNANSITSADLD